MKAIAVLLLVLVIMTVACSKVVDNSNDNKTDDQNIIDDQNITDELVSDPVDDIGTLDDIPVDESIPK